MSPPPVAHASGTGRLLGAEDLALPWPALFNPFSEVAVQEARRLAEAVGLLDREADRQRFQAQVTYAGLCYPLASGQRLVACAKFVCWLIFLDDRIDDDLSFAGDAGRRRRYMAAQAAVLLTGRIPGPLLDDPVARYGQALYRDLLTVAVGGRAWLRRFGDSLRGSLWRRRVDAAVPTDVIASGNAFLAGRQHDLGFYQAIDVCEIAMGLYLPDGVFGHLTVQRLRQLTAYQLTCCNDLYSLPKEVLESAAPSNLVHHLMAACALPPDEAIDATVRLSQGWADELTRLEGSLPAGGPVGLYLRGLRHLMRGNLDCCRSSARYPAEAHCA